MLLSIVFCWCISAVLAASLQENGPVKIKREIGGRIIGGQVAYAGQFPFLASINIHTNDALYFCSGALLTNQWVLTAGHCVDGGILFTIQLGSNQLDGSDSGTLKLTTDSFVLHPDYNPDTLENDIGLIEFRMPVTFTDYVKPVNLLPSAALSDNSPLVTMGWGQVDDEDPGLQDMVNYVSVTTISNAECRLFYGSQILDTMACAAGNYNEGICFGDTGGPLIQYVSRGQVMHVGVASFISQNGCESTDPKGYTRTFDYVAWIKNLTKFH
jgi:secreted trypsin-like serine protease